MKKLITLFVLIAIAFTANANDCPVEKSPAETVFLIEYPDGMIIEVTITQQPVVATCYDWQFNGFVVTSTGQVFYHFRQQCCNGGPEVVFLDCWFINDYVPMDE